MSNKFVLTVLLAFIIVFTLNSVSYGEEIVIEGIPIRRTSSSVEDNISDTITGEAQINHKLVITKSGNDYIWFSREKKRLKYSKRGIFHYFVNPEGSGYIKITKTKDNTYVYMEHMNIRLKTVTYWGYADRFEP